MIGLTSQDQFPRSIYVELLRWTTKSVCYQQPSSNSAWPCLRKAQRVLAAYGSWEGNRRSRVTLALRHRHSGLSTYGLKRSETEISSSPTFLREHFYRQCSFSVAVDAVVSWRCIKLVTESSRVRHLSAQLLATVFKLLYMYVCAEAHSASYP